MPDRNPTTFKYPTSGCFMQMQHFIQDSLPDSFNNMWSLNAYRRNAEFHIALRNDDIFDVPFARTSLTERKPLTPIS
jgi:hypothetical protein